MRLTNHLFQRWQLLVLICCFFTRISGQDDTTLQMVQVLFRHGDRTPARNLPKYNTSQYFPKGLGRLTELGMRQHFELGKFLSKYYRNLLSSIDPIDIYVNSTDIGRTLQSAYSHLAGLFRPTKSPFNEANLDWYPIPVHTKPSNEDFTLRAIATCPKYRQLENYLTKSSVVQKYIQEHEALLKYVGVNTGVGSEIAINRIYEVADILFVENLKNRTFWPSWVKNESIYNEVMAADDYWNGFLFHTDEMKMLAGGDLVRIIIENMEGFTQAEEMEETQRNKGSSLLRAPPPYRIFSAHDITVAAFLGAIDRYDAINNVLPPYTTSVLVELHRDTTTSTLQVQILVKNGTTGDISQDAPVPIIVPGCTSVGLCPLTSFKRAVSHIFPTDIRQQCQTTSDDGIFSKLGQSMGKFILIAICGVCILLFIITIMLCCFRRTNVKNRRMALKNMLINSPDDDIEQMLSE